MPRPRRILPKQAASTLRLGTIMKGGGGKMYMVKKQWQLVASGAKVNETPPKHFVDTEWFSYLPHDISNKILMEGLQQAQYLDNNKRHDTGVNDLRNRKAYVTKKSRTFPKQIELLEEKKKRLEHTSYLEALKEKLVPNKRLVEAKNRIQNRIDHLLRAKQLHERTTKVIQEQINARDALVEETTRGATPGQRLPAIPYTPRRFVPDYEAAFLRSRHGTATYPNWEERA